MNDHVTREIVNHLKSIIDIPYGTRRLVLTLDIDSAPQLLLETLVLDTNEPGEPTVTHRYELKRVDDTPGDTE